jgi:thiol-disulfide isomerase/thioredoxin
MTVTTKGGGYRTVSNGRTFYAVEASAPKKYYALPMPPEEAGPAGLMQYRAAGPIFTPLLAGIDTYSPPWGSPARSVTLGKTEVVAGAPADSVVLELPRPNPKITITYLIDRKSHLLRRAVMKASAGGKSYSMTESYTDIKVNPAIRLETFTFIPKPGMTKAGGADGAISWNPALKVGAAPPAFEATDLEGKPLNMEEYKGKVVLLDFWATWCSPCLEQIPFVKDAYQKYHDQGFEIVSISFDEDHAAVDSFTKAFGITWRQVCDGKAFDGPINKDFKVTAIPFMLLLGRDGKIAAIQPETLMLEPAVKKALAQKP